MFGIDLAQLTERLAGWVWSVPLFFLLLGCGLVFSVAAKFVQWRILTHGYACIRGHFDKPDDTGHINHFQALCAALSATIGLGNIAGVAVAVSVGGPGAIFWMWIVGFFGMALKFMECTLAVMFRDVRDVPDPSAPALTEADAETRALEYGGEPHPEPVTPPRGRGEVRGGPMWYIQKGLVERLRNRGNPLWVLFKILAVCFAAATMINALGQGNMFQGWNVADMLRTNFGVPSYASAVVVAGLVALVIIGGIKRIGQVAAKLVPFMCVAYVLGALWVIAVHYDKVGTYLALIVKSAFNPVAEGGAFAGISVMAAFTWGLKRALFSNEAGQGSAAMAHAAARTEEPIREGVVAGIGPFVDTLIICTMSALVLLMSGTWNRPALGTVIAVEDDAVVVQCTKELPETMRPLYLDRIQVAKPLDIHVARGVGVEFTELTFPVASIARDGERWQDMHAVRLDISGADEETRARIEPGQPVHLDLNGAEMTGFAFDTTVRGFGKYIVTLGVCLFAFSTMISWSYYGEKGAEYLLGAGAILPYKFIFVIFVMLGMVLPSFQPIYNFSDALCGLMVFCNLPAVLILSPRVLRAAGHYFGRLDAGQMPRVDRPRWS
jgi:AGCS family alanine or glycine:cation symporter